MQIKSELRKSAREKRRKLLNKENTDLIIAENLLSLEEYKNSQTVLIYASLEDEIKTDSIIDSALSENKRVAVPFCVDKQGKMEFYLINSLSQLKKGAFNVREPDVNSCERLDSFDNSVIIVPGLLFDLNGYRLGFGKGYYDRFLSDKSIFSVGLCYEELLVSSVPAESFDKKVDVIITQSNIIRCNSGGRNG